MDNCGLGKVCREGLLIALAVTSFLSVISVHFYERQHEYYQEQRYLNTVMCAENLVTGVQIECYKTAIEASCEVLEDVTYHGYFGTERTVLLKAMVRNMRRTINE